jgi:hypothetical protein
MIVYARDDDEYQEKRSIDQFEITLDYRSESYTEQDFLEHDEGDYDNPVFKLQDETHEISMETLGFYPSMFY